MGFKDWFGRGDRNPSNKAGSDGPALPPGEPRIVRALSLLPPDVAFRNGLAGAAIAGVFRSDDSSPDSFVQNSAFIEVVHRVIREHAPELPGFEQAARRQGEGSLSIIDLRTPQGPDGRVPPEDIVGAFAVSGGRASAGTYHPNPSYRAFTANGLLKLPEPLHSLLLDELKSLTAGAA